MKRKNKSYSGVDFFRCFQCANWAHFKKNPVCLGHSVIIFRNIWIRFKSYRSSESEFSCLVFSYDNRALFRRCFRTETNTFITKRLVIAWLNLPKDIKQNYQRLADKVVDLHNVVFSRKKVGRKPGSNYRGRGSGRGGGGATEGLGRGEGVGGVVVVATTETEKIVGGESGGGAKRMLDEEGAPCHKKARSEAEQEQLVKNRPFFQQTSSLFHKSLFAFDGTLVGKEGRNDFDNGFFGGRGGGAGGLFPHPTSYRFGPRPGVPFDTAASDSSVFTSPPPSSSSPHSAAALDNLSNNLNPFRPMPPPPTPASHTKATSAPYANGESDSRGRRSMFPLRNSARTCTGDSTSMQQQQRKSRSGTAMDLDNGDFSLGEDYPVEREFSGVSSNLAGGGGEADVSATNLSSSRLFIKPHAQSVPVPTSQQQQHSQQQHLQRRRASFGEFSAVGLLTSLEDHPGGDSMEYFPTVETPCNSPTGKMELAPLPPSSAIFRPEAVTQSLFVAGLPCHGSDDPEKLFIDTDDSDED